MDETPHLQAQDRLAFEGLLDEVLRSPEIRDALRSAPGDLSQEQLRTRALHSADAIARAAAEEYASYTALRESARGTAATADPAAAVPSCRSGSLKDAVRSAGLAQVAAAWVPFLTGASALMLLTLGYCYRILDDGSSTSSGLIIAGLVCGAVCVAALAMGLVGIVVTAARGSDQRPAGHVQRSEAQLAAARSAWRDAVRNRGILPYLRQELTEDAGPAIGGNEPPQTGAGPLRERAHLGYTSPAFGSPGPTGLSDEDGDESRPHAHQQHFASPDFTSPDFTSPDYDGAATLPLPRRPCDGGDRPGA